jgi:hypothetical protein
MDKLLPKKDEDGKAPPKEEKDGKGNLLDKLKGGESKGDGKDAKTADGKEVSRVASAFRRLSDRANNAIRVILFCFDPSFLPRAGGQCFDVLTALLS